MTPEQLQEAKETKGQYREGIIFLREKAHNAEQEYYRVSNLLQSAIASYEAIDREIAEVECLTICPPAGSRLVRANRRKKWGLTKEEALKLIQELWD